LRVLVASPGDVQAERQAIPEVIASWAEYNSVDQLRGRLRDDLLRTAQRGCHPEISSALKTWSHPAVPPPLPPDLTQEQMVELAATLWDRAPFNSDFAIPASWIAEVSDHGTR
jgi:hypothetical protein